MSNVHCTLHINFQSYDQYPFWTFLHHSRKQNVSVCAGRMKTVVNSKDVVWNDRGPIGLKYLVGYYRCSGKNSPPLKSTSLVVYQIYVVLIICLDKYRRWLTENGHTLVCLLLGRVGSDLEYSWSVQERRSSVYWFKDIDEVHAEENWDFPYRYIQVSRRSTH